jgi:predicted dehydrogenase
MADGRLSIGIIGAGIMGQRFLRGILEPGAEIARAAGIWDPSAEAMAHIAEACPGVPRAQDAVEIIAKAECVYIASPPASHLGYARKALAAGKVVFSEKPLAVDVADARAFVDEAGDRAAVNFPFASSLAVHRLHRWAAERAVGQPERITIEVAFADWPRSWQRDAASWLDHPAQGGLTREVVSHFLFLSRRIGGALTGLEGRAIFPEAGRAERSIRATLRAGELPVALTGDVGSTAKDDHNIFTLEGSAGAVRLRDWGIAERQDGDGTWHEERTAPAMTRDEERMAALNGQLQGLVRLARGEPHHLATLAEALNVQETVEGLLASRW